MPEQQSGEAPSKKPNLFLSVVGAVLLIVAIAGFFMDKNAAVTGGFLLLGVTTCIIAVLAPRLEGEQQFSMLNTKLTLDRRIAAGERDLQAGKYTEIVPDNHPDIEGPPDNSPADEPASGSDGANVHPGGDVVRSPAGRNPGGHSSRPPVLVNMVEDAQKTVSQMSPREYRQFVALVQREFYDHVPDGRVVESTRNDGRRYFHLKIPDSKLRVVYRTLDRDEMGEQADVPGVRGYGILAIVDTASETI